MPVFGRRRPDAVALTGGLLVGSAPTTRQAKQLVRDGVTAVIDLRAEAGGAANWPTHVIVERIPFVDHGTPSADDVRVASERTTELLRGDHKVLLHCRAGLQRAPTVACAVLMQQGWALADAYRLVTARRRGVAPTDGQLAALRQLEQLMSSRRHRLAAGLTRAQSSGGGESPANPSGGAERGPG